MQMRIITPPSMNEKRYVDMYDLFLRGLQYLRVDLIHTNFMIKKSEDRIIVEFPNKGKLIFLGNATSTSLDSTFYGNRERKLNEENEENLEDGIEVIAHIKKDLLLKVSKGRKALCEEVLYSLNEEGANINFHIQFYLYKFGNLYSIESILRYDHDNITQIAGLLELEKERSGENIQFIPQHQKKTVYGSFSLDKEGNYQYILDNFHPVIRSLKAFEYAEDVFSVEIYSGFDYKSELQFSILIEGTNDEPKAYPLLLLEKALAKRLLPTTPSYAGIAELSHTHSKTLYNRDMMLRKTIRK